MVVSLQAAEHVRDWFMQPPQCVICGTLHGPWIYPVNNEDVCLACGKRRRSDLMVKDEPLTRPMS